MATTVGNYSHRHEPESTFENGELVDFECTSCHTKLDSDDYKDYAQLTMKVEENIQFDVLFSRRVGVQKTYLITENGIETYAGT